MNFNKKLFKATILLGVFCPAVLSIVQQNPTLAGSIRQKSCNLAAYLGADTEGLNVRGGPSSQDRIIGQLSGDTIVDIIGVSGNWANIERAYTVEEVNQFQGSGWVYFPLLGTSPRGEGGDGVVLYADSSESSRQVGTVTPYLSVKTLSCDGEWVRVSSGGTQGWLKPEDQCPNPVTTCP